MTCKYACKQCECGGKPARKFDFMIVAPPRCATAWLANLFTTDLVACDHEVIGYSGLLNELSIERLEGRLLEERWPYRTHFGLADTCLAVLAHMDVLQSGTARLLNDHPARKLIVHRDLEQVNDSLERVGLPPMEVDLDAALWKVNGLHVMFHELFDDAVMMLIHRFLTHEDGEFDLTRFRFLKQMNVQNVQALELARVMVEEAV